MTENALPKMKWVGYDSVIQVELWLAQDKTLIEIAKAYSLSRPTLNKRMNEAKEAMNKQKAALQEQSGANHTDEDDSGNLPKSTASTTEENKDR